MTDTYLHTRDRLEQYFDRTAARTWERLTSDAPVSRIRQTVREGRDRMRALMLDRLPGDLHGARVLDAGCGAGPMSIELASRGARVIATDISPRLLAVARERTPAPLRPRIDYLPGDMLDPGLGSFDFVVAMDSLIHYRTDHIAQALADLSRRTVVAVVFTVAPRTPLLTAMHVAGFLYFVRGRVLRQTQNFVVVAFCHVRFRLAPINNIKRAPSPAPNKIASRTNPA
jgi:magnesium-protoporphyrin O-methyltransferase